MATVMHRRAAVSLVVAAFAVAALAVLLLAWGNPIPDDSLTVDVRGPTEPGSSAGSVDTAGITLDGRTPDADLPTRTALGPADLGDPVDEVHAALSEPDEILPDLNGWMHVWSLPGGAQYGVSTWEDDTYEVAGLYGSVPQGSDVRIALYGDLTLGEATVGEIVERWGPGAEPALHTTDDYVVQYVDCIGQFPVIVKVDAAGADEQGLLGPEAFDLPATSVLTGFVDGPPGILGCSG